MEFQNEKAQQVTLKQRCKNAFVDLDDRICRILHAVENGSQSKNKIKVRLKELEEFSRNTKIKPPISFVKKLESLPDCNSEVEHHTHDHDIVLEAETEHTKPLPIKQPGIVQCWENLISDSLPVNANKRQDSKCIKFSLLKSLTFERGEAAETLRARQNKKWAFRCYEKGKTSLQKMNGNFKVNLNRDGAELELEKARNLFESARTLDPTLTAANLELGFIFTKQGKVDEAVACYKSVLKSEPENFQARVRLHRLGVTVPYLNKHANLSSSSSSRLIAGFEYISGDQEQKNSGKSNRNSNSNSNSELIDLSLSLSSSRSEPSSSEIKRKRTSESDSYKDRKRKKKEKGRKKSSKPKKHKKIKKRKRHDYSDESQYN